MRRFWFVTKSPGRILGCFTVSYLDFLQAWGDVSAPGSGFGPVGEVRLIPVQDTVIRALPWRPHHAIAICELHNSPGVVLSSDEWHTMEFDDAGPLCRPLI